MSNTSPPELPYKFWLPLALEVVVLFVTIYFSYLVFQEGQRIDAERAKPHLEQIGRLKQFPGDDNIREIRLKNFSTQQDAVVTSIELTITDPAFLKSIGKRDQYFGDVPPRIQMESIQPGSEIIKFAVGDWNREGTSYSFKQDVDLNIPPGKAATLRLNVVDPEHRPQLWDQAWFQGNLTIHYDNEKIDIPDVILNSDKLKPGLPEIPPTW